MREILGSSIEQRYVKTYEELEEKISALRALGYKIGLTSGSWDMFHIGHARYIERLKEKVDIVIIGVDSDEKIRGRKGPTRPVVPEGERLEILCHMRHVDIVFVKANNDKQWQLIRTVKPDVLLISVRNKHSEKELEELNILCGEIMLIESQATTSTSARIRRLHVSGIAELKIKLDEIFKDFLGDSNE